MVSIRTVSLVLIVVAASACEFGETELVGPGACEAVPQCLAGDNPDPLHTCSPSFDKYDCTVLDLAKNENEPDPMIFKAMIRQESAFDMFAISPDSPCGDEAGWTVPETKSFGLMQLTPACGWLKEARLPDGHPNLARDEAAPEWATSVFNPTVNVGAGVRAFAENRSQLMKTFPGCTDVEYIKMALGAFNQGPGAILGCNNMSPSAKAYVNNVVTHHANLSNSAGWPIRY